ncbi:hypothetical protein [Devosia ginsengisoli]|uniref:hypothetical protein n=1 Tax=Devosia ginsengisoli TaxID=400770 RepID=UPI0026F24162|nr:hypothetical protein [Devosia ginsengisoli]MCR6672720.1 hypothetical protein [Devosia ginsengisoli]
MSVTVDDQKPPKPVSRWYFFDWQYVLKIGRLPILKPAALVITAAPLVGNIGQVAAISTTGFWYMWWASVLSLAAFGITKISCPRIVQEYETYEDYEKRGHSHRFLVWLFHHNLNQFPTPDAQLREVVAKQVATSCDAADGPAAVPVMPPASTDGKLTFPPVNANRDLYLGFWRNGRRYVLTLEEGDPKLPEKSKELFWIISSALLSSKPILRKIVWLLYGASLALSLWSLWLNLIRPWFGSDETTLTFGDRLVKALVILLGGSP